MFDKLVDNAGLTRPEFLMDDIHLSQRSMPFVVEWFREHVPKLVPKDYQLPNTGSGCSNDDHVDRSVIGSRNRMGKFFRELTSILFSGRR